MVERSPSGLYPLVSYDPQCIAQMCTVFPVVIKTGSNSCVARREGYREQVLVENRYRYRWEPVSLAKVLNDSAIDTIAQWTAVRNFCAASTACKSCKLPAVELWTRGAHAWERERQRQRQTHIEREKVCVEGKIFLLDSVYLLLWLHLPGN